MTGASIDTGEHEQSDRARQALEQVCARGDFEAARKLYSADFVDHVNGLEFRGHEDWTVSDNLELIRQLGIRRGMMLALRWLTGRLPRGQKPSGRG